MPEDYEILPHQLLSDLKSEVEALKRKLTQPDTKANELILEMESLKDTIHELTTTFQKALEQTNEAGPEKILASLNDKIEKILKQNETIATGMVAISDKVEDFIQKQQGGGLVSSMPPPMPSPYVSHTMGAPPTPGPSRMAPKPFAPPTMSDDDFPPPPPGMKSSSEKKRVGLFK